MSAEAVDALIISEENINKCPMMRRLLAKVETELVWWFDDDSWIKDADALERWLKAVRRVPPEVVMWGQMFFVSHAELDLGGDAVQWVRDAAWYADKEPPSWKPGGKGVFRFNGKVSGDGRWIFVTGGCWMARTSALRAIGWPDPRLIKEGDDVVLGEAIRQQGWRIANIGPIGRRRRRGGFRRFRR